MPAEGQPLTGRVIVTRSAADNRSLVAALADAGFGAIELPLIEVLPPLDGGRALEAAVADLGRYRWVTLTSVNGVQALHRAIAGQSWPPAVTVAPVGERTATAARALGMTVGQAPPIATVESLVDAFPTWTGSDGREVLAPVAELAGPTLVDGLAAKGWRVTRVTAYRTAAPVLAGPDAIDRHLALIETADAVTFFSPSAVDRFVERYGAAAVPGAVVVIGPSTAERAADRGLGRVVIAGAQTEAGVVSAVVAALGDETGPEPVR